MDKVFHKPPAINLFPGHGINMLTFCVSQGYTLEKEAILRIHPALAANKDFNGLSGCENTKDGLHRVTQWSVGLELVTDRCGMQVFDLEL